MAINSVGVVKTHAAHKSVSATNTKSFADVVQSKMNKVQPSGLELIDNAKFALKNTAREVAREHRVALQTIEKSFAENKLSPEHLLRLQYSTGMIFIRQQMFCKTAELAANTFNQMIKMQI